MSFKKRSLHSHNESDKLRNQPAVTAEAILHYYEALDCPRSLTCYMLFKYGEHDQLCQLECDPLHFNSSASFRDAYMSTAFVSKATFLTTSFDKRALAIEKFEKFESQCRETNIRLRKSFVQMNEFTGHGKLLSAMRRKIKVILGQFSPHEMFDLASWGPGVSTLIKGVETFGAKKFQYETGITRDLYPLARDLFPLAYPGWWSSLLETKGFPHFEVGNKVVTVPKTSKIDRVIAIEPGINLWFQLGIGRMIQRRLGRFGVDLQKQEINQRLAKRASFDGSLATVDFSSASDSIAYSLVEELFSESPAWFEALDIARSKYGNVDGKMVRWEKFSSMGNGFTFPLESLIFFTAACVCCSELKLPVKDVSVYGDDVILPVAAYDLFSSFSSFLGFTVNPVKSFAASYFRESCGSHYWQGVDCKPLYLIDTLSSPQKVFNFANSLRLRFHYPYLPSGGFGCDRRVRGLFYKLQGLIPKKLRFKVPATYNPQSERPEPFEGGFISNFDEACPWRLKDQTEGFGFKRLAWVAIQREVDYAGLLLSRLARQRDTHWTKFLLSQNWKEYLESEGLPQLMVDKGDGNTVTLRGRTRRIFTNSSVRRWYDLGPWI